MPGQSHSTKSENDKLYEWLVWPQAYLASALYLAQKILPRSDVMNFDLIDSRRNLFGELGFRSEHSNYYIIWPIIFNFKHGIELWLKGLAKLINVKHRGIHDVVKLFGMITRQARQQSEYNYNVLINLNRRMRPIVKRYWYGAYQRKRIQVRDKQNEAERYPERLRERKTYLLREPEDWVNYNSILMIIRDIEIVEKNFAKVEREVISP